MNEDQLKIGNPRIAHARGEIPHETLVVLERLHELIRRIEEGELGEVQKAVVLLLNGRVLTVAPLGKDMSRNDVRGLARALVDTLEAEAKIGAFYDR